MLIGAENFLHTLYGTRTLWIKGDLGSYKTALAYRLAYELMENKKFGYRYVLSNIPDVWSDRPENVKIRYKKSVNSDRINPFGDAIVILDEGGHFIKMRSEVEMIFDALRKINVLVMVPSKDEPHRVIRSLRVWRKYDLHNYGLDGVIYGWKKKYEDEDITGSFAWLGVSEIYGVFDSEYYPVDSDGIDEWLAKLKNELTQGQYERNKQQRTSVEVQGVAASGGEDVAGELEEVLDEIGSATKKFISVSRRRR